MVTSPANLPGNTPPATPRVAAVRPARRMSPVAIGLAVVGVIFLAMTILVSQNVAGMGQNQWLRVFFSVPTLNFALRFSIPLVLGALGGILCERTGIVNIGIEGMMLAGAFAAFVAKVSTNGWPVWISLLFAVAVGLLIGGLMGLLHATFSIRYRMDQIISGTVIIILAAGFTTYFFNPNDMANAKFSPIQIPVLGQIPVVGEVLFRNPPITYLALILVVVVHIGLFHTRWGLRSRACGEHPRAADTVGIKVNRYRYLNTMLGGMLAGLAGTFLVLEAVGQFQENMTAGRGFISLAAMIFGNWMPFGALGASLLFGYTQGLQNALLLEGVTNIPRQFIGMIPYVVTIIAVSGLVGRVRAPAAEGKVYDTEGGSE